MGYLKQVVDTGLQYADQYKMPEYVAKVRCSSKAVDATVAKIDSVLREQGTPLVEKFDTMMDSKLEQYQPQVAKVMEKKDATLEYAQSKKDELKLSIDKLAIYAINKKEEVNTKKTEVVQFAQSKKDEAVEFAQSKKSEAVEFAQTKTTEVTTLTKEKVAAAVETSKAKFEVASTKAAEVKKSGEKQLRERAVGNKYAEQTVTKCIDTTDCVLEMAQGIFKKSLTPLTLIQERAEQYVSYAKETTTKTTAFAQELPARAFLLIAAVKLQVFAMLSAASVQKDTYQSTFSEGGAKATYEKAVEQAKELKETLFTTAEPYLASTKESFAKAKQTATTGAGKLQPFLLESKEKAFAYFGLNKAKSA